MQWTNGEGVNGTFNINDKLLKEKMRKRVDKFKAIVINRQADWQLEEWNSFNQVTR